MEGRTLTQGIEAGSPVEVATIILWQGDSLVDFVPVKRKLGLHLEVTISVMDSGYKLFSSMMCAS